MNHHTYVKPFRLLLMTLCLRQPGQGLPPVLLLVPDLPRGAHVAILQRTTLPDHNAFAQDAVLNVRAIGDGSVVHDDRVHDLDVVSKRAPLPEDAPLDAAISKEWAGEPKHDNNIKKGNRNEVRQRFQLLPPPTDLRVSYLHLSPILTPSPNRQPAPTVVFDPTS